MMRKNGFAKSEDGIRIAYEVHGHGTPLLLLHGFSDSRESWNAAGYTDDLASRGHRVILIDARGHGESDRPREAEAYSVGRVLADLAAVLDTLGLPHAAAMGFSLGGEFGTPGPLILAMVRVRTLSAMERAGFEPSHSVQWGR